MLNLHFGKRNITSSNQFLQNALKIDPNNVEARLMLAQLQIREKKFDQALVSLGKVIDKKPQIKNKQIFVDALILRSQIYLNQKNSEKANESIARLNEINSEHPTVIYLLAASAFQEGDLLTASSKLNQLLQLSPDHASGLFLMASVKFFQNYNIQAESYLKRYLKQYANDPAAKKLLAKIKISSGKYGEVFEIFDGENTNYENDTELQKLLGQAALHQGDKGLAERYFGKSISASLDADRSKNEVANLYLSSGEFEKVIKLFEDVEIDHASNQAAAQLLIRAYVGSGKKPEALDAINSYLSANPSNGNAHLFVGDAYAVLGNKANAKKHYLESERLNKKSFWFIKSC